MLAGLCEAIDARPYMEGHGSRVSRLAETIAPTTWSVISPRTASITGKT